MTAKQVLFRSAAREKVLRGTAQLADAGVTIAKEMALEDPEENFGAQMLRQAAKKTSDVVGDAPAPRSSWTSSRPGSSIR